MVREANSLKGTAPSIWPPATGLLSSDGFESIVLSGVAIGLHLTH